MLVRIRPCVMSDAQCRCDRAERSFKNVRESSTDQHIMLRKGSVIAQSIATELAKDEYNHVVFLRTALGAAAVPIPLVLLLARHAHCPCMHEACSHGGSWRLASWCRP